MNSRLRWAFMLATIAAFHACPTARADDKGQADLDQAMELKLSAQNLADLGKVIKLCESAQAAGLNEANTKFAGDLLAGTLLQRAEVVANQIFDAEQPPTQWPQLRRLALGDLERVVKLDAKQASAHLLIGRLQSLPRGDRKQSIAALDEAIKLLGENEPGQRARALVLRATLTEDAQRREADYNEAVKLAPHSAEVLRARGIYHLVQNKHAEALVDLDVAVEADPKNADAQEARGVALSMLKRYDDALAAFDKAAALAPESPLPHTHRARIHALQGDVRAAVADLDEAHKVDPNSIAVLLLRARVHQQSKDTAKALADVDEALRLRPDSRQALEFHAALMAAQNKFDEAARDLETLQKLLGDNVELELQLGMVYSAGKQSAKAVETFSRVIAADAKHWLAYRGRADAYLNEGKQAEAVADYEAALKLQPDDSGILNNLAWVLATSPNEKLRDGKRSIELAQAACKATDYKQSHVLSTLAAAYAETGDFAEALKWSQKAVDLGTRELKPQLDKELESYRQKKPWREESPTAVGVEESLPDDDDADFPAPIQSGLDKDKPDAGTKPTGSSSQGTKANTKKPIDLSDDLDDADADEPNAAPGDEKDREASDDDEPLDLGSIKLDDESDE